MRSFDTQAEFELYWFGKAEASKPAGFRASDKAFIVYFTASWCGPCKRLDIDSIENFAKQAGVPIWKVEQTVNDYTAGYCDVRSLPTFALMRPRLIVSKVSSSNTSDVLAWMSTVVSAPGSFPGLAVAMPLAKPSEPATASASASGTGANTMLPEDAPEPGSIMAAIANARNAARTGPGPAMFRASPLERMGSFAPGYPSADPALNNMSVGAPTTSNEPMAANSDASPWAPLN